MRQSDCSYGWLHWVPKLEIAKAPTNGTVHLWIGTSPDRHIMLTAGQIPTWLQCVFVIKNAE